MQLSLGQIRAVLAADPRDRRRLLAEHRARLAADLTRAQRAIHWLNRIIDEEEPIMTTASPAVLDRATHRQLAADLFNHVWTLLEMRERTPEQDDEMIHAAHASRYHWGEVGEAVHRARGEWQCSRVYAVLGRGEPALFHAARSLALCEQHRIGDFDLAFAYEAMARAHRVARNDEEAAQFVALASAAGERIAEDDDRELFLSDLATVAR
jgi:hypothetical protein